MEENKDKNFIMLVTIEFPCKHNALSRLTMMKEPDFVEVISLSTTE